MSSRLVIIPIERHCMPLLAYRWCRASPAMSAVATLALLAGCGGSSGDPPTGQPPVTPVASVTIGAPAMSVTVGGTLQLAATLRDQSGNVLSGRTVAWTTSNPGVASVSSTGLVTGVATGSTTIRATSEGKSTAATITVTARTSRDFAIVGAQ